MSQISEDEIEIKVTEFQRWIQTQPQLPQNIDELLLIRYLKTYNFNVEKAQNLLVYSLNMRQKYPHIFTNRDFFSEEFENVKKAVDMVPLLETTPENWKVCIVRLSDYDPNNINFNHCIKAFFMVSDVRLVTRDRKILSDGECPIFDMKGMSYRHLPKLVFSTLKMYMKYTQEAHPVRVRQVHIVNCSSLLGLFFRIAKPLVHADVLQRIHFHTPNSDTLFKCIPAEILPEEYGGTGGKFEVLRENFTKLLMNKRDYVMNDDNWKVTKQHPQVDELKENQLLNSSRILQTNT